MKQFNLLSQIVKDFEGELSLYWDFICQHDPARIMDWGNYTVSMISWCFELMCALVCAVVHHCLLHSDEECCRNSGIALQCYHEGVGRIE